MFSPVFLGLVFYLLFMGGQACYGFYREWPSRKGEAAVVRPKTSPLKRIFIETFVVGVGFYILASFDHFLQSGTLSWRGIFFVAQYWFMPVAALGLYAASRRYRGLPWGLYDTYSIIIALFLAIAGFVARAIIQ